MLVRSTNSPSNWASASTLAQSMREVAGAYGLDEAAEAFVADQRLVAMGELAVEAGEKGGPSVGILPGLLLVAAEHIAPPRDRSTSLMASWVSPFWRGMTSGTATPSSSITSLRTSLVDRSRTPRMYSKSGLLQRRHGGGADHAAIGDDAEPGDAEALAQPLRPPACSRVTSAVLPGHRKEANGRSSPSSTMPSTTCLRCAR